MSLIIATGSNLGNRLQNLLNAKLELSKVFKFKNESEVFASAAVENEDQPDFYNQVLEFEIPDSDPDQTMLRILEIEKSLGRIRTKRYGERIIDIDIIFWDLEKLNTKNLQTPHPKWDQRSFVVKPLQQLPFFKKLEKYFTIVKSFEVDAKPIKE